MKLNISSGQMDIALGEPEKNLSKVRGMTAEARRRGSEVVLFPELWSTGYDLKRAGEHANLTTEEKSSDGRDVFGYASSAQRILDERFACAWTVQSTFHPANADERNHFPEHFAHLQARFPWLKIGEVLADAALGYRCCLDPIWQAGALRIVDIRAAQGDQDSEVQLRRGYNDRGYPLCIHGYQMSPNGHDYQRRRTKWICRKACLKDSRRPVPDCPYLADQHKHGQVVNVGRALPDGSVRLAREVPYGFQAWKKRYGRRNLSESRNSSLEGMGLKRLPNFGLTRNRKEIAISDFLVNLCTLSRLVQEATTLALKATVSWTHFFPIPPVG